MRERARIISNEVTETYLTSTFEEREAWAMDPWGPVYTADKNLPGNQQVDEGMEFMADTSTPGFYRRRIRGDIINNPMIHSKFTKHWDPVVLNTHAFKEHRDPTYFSHQRTYKSSGTYPWSKVVLAHHEPYVDTIDVENLKRLSASKCYAKLVASSAQLWVSLAEADKSISTIKSVLYKVSKLLRHVKNKNIAITNALYYAKRPREIRKLTRELSDLWLEFRFGVRPLVYDVVNIIEAIQKSPASKRRTFVANEGDTTQKMDTSTKDQTFGYCYTTTEYNTTALCSVNVKTYILAEAQIELGGLEFGLAQILGTAWELIPLSFVIDWFWNVGQVLLSWEPIQQFRVLGSGQVISTTETLYGEIKIRPSRYLSGLGCTCTASGGGNTVQTSVHTERNPDVSKPVVPAIKIRLNKAKLVDLLALVRSLGSDITFGKGLRRP